MYKRRKTALLAVAVPLVSLGTMAILSAVTGTKPTRGMGYYLLAQTIPSLSFLEKPLQSLGVIGPDLFEIAPGVKALLDPRDTIARHFLLEGHYEREEWGWISDRLGEGKVFVDVGAHIGIYSLRAAKQVGAAGRVYAFEPNPSTLQKLRLGISANHFQGIVRVLPVACGERHGKMKLYAPSDLNTGMASLSSKTAAASGSTGTEYVEVDVVPLDDALPALNRIDVLKIDTEGAETMILRGARLLIEKHRPAVVLETVESHLAALGSSKAELDSLMASYGYKRHSQTGTNALWVHAP